MRNLDEELDMLWNDLRNGQTPENKTLFDLLWNMREGVAKLEAQLLEAKHAEEVERLVEERDAAVARAEGGLAASLALQHALLEAKHAEEVERLVEERDAAVARAEGGLAASLALQHAVLEAKHAGEVKRLVEERDAALKQDFNTKVKSVHVMGERDEWRNAAFHAVKQLIDHEPQDYHTFTAAEWREWVAETIRQRIKAQTADMRKVVEVTSGVFCIATELLQTYLVQDDEGEHDEH